MGGGTASFLPFVAFGFIAWQFISQLVLDGCNVFIANGPIIQQLQAPLSIYIYQTIWRHLIILAHNLLIYVVIALLYGLWPSWQTLLVIPGIILVSINGISIGMLLGTLCARFRDIPPIVQTITQMMFLLTPILWRPNQIPGRELFYLLNPFYYLVEIIRAPLEGRAPSLFVWMVAIQGDVQPAAARLLAAAKPRLASARRSRKRSSGSRNALAEPSLESLSTMIASKQAKLCTASASMQFCNSGPVL
ncbi:MAG TPA: ABC transporter permease [Methyloceanibacter sp.]